jgi:ElaB/YqjD/DUF883 family membrane-anchored ribosome-binding protein
MTLLNSADAAVHENPQDGRWEQPESGYKASAVMKELGDAAYQAGSRAGARVARRVETQPMMAALIAASLGLIVGMLLPRR